MLPIDLSGQYRAGASPIHRLDPRIKLIGTVLFILAATVLPYGAWRSYALLWLATLLVAQRAQLGLFYALRRSYVALPFALAAITLPFVIPGETLAQWGALHISVEGTLRFASIVVKSWVSLQIAVLMATTTAFPELLWGLRALRLPKTLASIIGFMYRYLFVLVDESGRLLRARAARSAEGPRRSGGGLWWRGRVAGGMVGNLTIRAFERSERVYAAMAARGFQGELKSLAEPQMTDTDRSALVGWVTFLAMVVLIGIVL